MQSSQAALEQLILNPSHRFNCRLWLMAYTSYVTPSDPKLDEDKKDSCILIAL